MIPFFRLIQVTGVHYLMRSVHLFSEAQTRRLQRFRMRFRAGAFESFGQDCGICAKVTVRGKTRVKLGNRVHLGRGVFLGGGGEIRIGNHTCINAGTIVCSRTEVLVGDGCMIAAYCYIIDTDHVFNRVEVPIREQGYASRKVVIGNDVWVGSHSIIAKGVTIGDGAVVGANSFVNRDVPALTVVAGSPAVVIGSRDRLGE